MIERQSVIEHREQEAARHKAEMRRQAVVAAITPRHIVWRHPLFERLNAHAVTLALQYRLRVIRREDGGGCADAERRTIWTPAVVNEAAYAVFLHEVGHAVDPQADSRQYADAVIMAVPGTPSALVSMQGEIHAWRWAVAHALVWTVAMQNRMYEGLLGYAGRGSTREQRFQMWSALTVAAGRIADGCWADVDDKRARLVEAR